MMIKTQRMRLFLITITIVAILFGCKNNIYNSNERKLSTLKNDTTYYHVHIGAERMVINEFIKTYRVEDLLYANISTSYSYELESFKLDNVLLTQGQIDTLDNFSNMLRLKNIRNNYFAPAGRYGFYQTIIHGDTTKFESKNLYSLTNALGYIDN